MQIGSLDKLTAIASAIVLANGVDHCRAGDDAHRIFLDSVHREHVFASGLELAVIFKPAVTIMSRTR